MKHPAYSQLRPVTANAAVVLAPNPSYGSLEGTNSWVIRDPEDEYSIVVDPGPADEGHLNVLQAKADKVALIILTHRHHDHADGAERFRQLTGAPVRAFDPNYCSDGVEPLQDGEVISVDGVTPKLKVVHTPGHTSDCVCLYVYPGEPEGAPEGIITGDTIAGRHTTMISETDGDLGLYLETLAKLEEDGHGVMLLPGHGPEGEDLSAYARKYIDRRNQRLEQIREALATHGQDADINTLVDAIYDDVDPVLRGAAEQSTRVALRYLQKEQ